MANVLVVEPDVASARSIAQAVRTLGHSIRTLASGEVAKKLLTQERIAVLIAELKNNGLDLLRTAKLSSRGTRVIFVSTDASANEYKRAISEGAVDVLVKPFSPADLQDALRRAFDASEGAKSIIHNLSLTDLLQIMHMGMRSVTVKLSPGEGRIHMARGQIVHATHYLLSGTAALRSMLAIEPTAIETAPACDVAITIDAQFEMLLLDLMRQIDEERRLSLDIVIEEVEPEPEPEVQQELEPELAPELALQPVAGAPQFAASLFLAMALVAIFIVIIGISEAL